MPLNIAYLINEYPKVSHAFIRREILALEQRGMTVFRISLRGWDTRVLGAEDERERTKTRYVLKDGLFPLFLAMLKVFLTSPMSFFSALMLAMRMGWRGDRPMPYHLAYLAEACRILGWVKEQGCVHIHAHFGTNSAEVAMLTTALGGPPFSFTVHGPLEFDRPKQLGLGEKIRRAAFVVGITSFARSQLFRLVDHEFWPKIMVVHCGLEKEFYVGHARDPSSHPRLVCIGRLCEQKGQLLLIEAAAQLARKAVAFELVLVGDGEMREEIEAAIRKKGLDDLVRLTGAASSEQVRKELLDARCLVLPSFAEGLPMVIMEAMALRRPALTTYVAGIPELVIDGKTGWLFPAGSVDELVLAMENALSRSTEELRLMGDAAYNRVIARHSIDTEAAKLALLFEGSTAI